MSDLGRRYRPAASRLHVCFAGYLVAFLLGIVWGAITMTWLRGIGCA
jgi:hypothetical protein